MRLILLLSLSLCSLSGFAQKFYLFVGTYTNGNSTSKGIYAYRFYERNGQLAYLSEIDNVSNPSYLYVTNNNKFIYAVNEGPQGEVSSFTFNPVTGKMAFIRPDLLNSYEHKKTIRCYFIKRTIIVRTAKCLLKK